MMKLPNIQILRAVAALAVVFYHDGIETTNVCTSTGRTCGIDFWVGGFGVPLFFMISGFIMVTTSWNNFAKPGAPLDFLKRRITRIVPLYWLVTSFAVVGIMLSPSMLNVPVLEPFYIAASYLFWPVARINGLVRPIANLGWTLNLEMMFYAVFTIALLFNRVRGLAMSMVFLGVMAALHSIGMFGKTGLLPSTPLNFWADPIILNFILGMLIAVIYRNGSRLSFTDAGLLIAISLIGILIVGNLGGYLDTLPEDHIINRLAAIAPILCLFVAGALGPQVDITKLVWSVGLLIGDASYSLYLIHPFALRLLGKLWVKLAGDHLPVWPFTMIGLALALTAGVLLYFLVERPLTNYFGKRGRSEKIQLPVGDVQLLQS